MKHNRRTIASSRRQQARVQQRGHLRRSTLVALVLVAVIGVTTTQALRHPDWQDNARTKFVDWSVTKGFAVQHVNVTGRQTVPSSFVMEALQIQRGTPILSYDPQAAQARLALNPWFKTVKIERRLPDTIFVHLLERTPIARWQFDGKQALVDQEGVILAADPSEKYNQLPVIIGQDARHKIADLFTVLRAEPDIGREVNVATWIGNRRWDLKLKNGMVIKLPADQPALAFSQVATLNRDEAILKRDLVSIDMRLADKAVLQPSTRANALIERPSFSDKPEMGKKNI